MRKISEFNGIPIKFNKDNGYFYCGNHESRDYRELVDTLTRDSKTDYSGDFYAKGYDGKILKFTAKKRYYTDYDDCWMVRGVLGNSYGGGRDERLKEETLYPVNEHNTALLDEQTKINNEGWALIRKSDRLSQRLIK